MVNVCSNKIMYFVQPDETHSEFKQVSEATPMKLYGPRRPTDPVLVNLRFIFISDCKPYKRPPRGCPITQSRKFFSIFTQSRTYFPAFTQSYKLVTFFQFHAITHRFFPISRNHANKKGLFTPSRTPKRPFTHHAHMSASRNHAIIFSFSRNHAFFTQQKGPFTQSRKPMGGPHILLAEG